MADFEFYFRRTIWLIELAAFIIGLIHYKTYKKTPNKIIIYFLGLVLLTEFLSTFATVVWRYPESQLTTFLKAYIPDFILNNNIWIGSIYSILSFYIFLIYFKRLAKSENSRLRMFNGLLIIYTASVFYDLIHYKTLYENWMGDTHGIVGSLCSLVAAMLYMRVMLKSDNVVHFFKMLSFWVMIGIVFFNLVTVPIFTYANHLGFSGPVYLYTLVFSNYVMYGFFIIGFIVHARQSRMKSEVGIPKTEDG